MKTLISFIVFVILLVVAAHLVISAVDDVISKEQNRYEKFLKTNVVVGKDTLQIVDYSIWEENYILSNGTKVSRKFVEITPTTDK